MDLKKKVAFLVYKCLSWHNKYNLKKQLDAPNVKLGEYVMIADAFNLELPQSNYQLELGTRVNFKKYCNVLLFPNSKLIIEENVFFNNYCSINCLGEIRIGLNCIFGEGVKLYDHNHKHEYVNGELKVARDDYNIGSIVIGNNCWIGSNVTILKNVVIGDNVIIGANVLIYKSIASNSIIKSKTETIMETK